MPKETVKRIHLIYRCIVSALIVALSIALMLSCLDIYKSGPRPYSPTSIAQRFDRIAVLVYVAVAMIMVGFILSLVMPLEEQRPKAIRDDLTTMKKLKRKAGILDEDVCKPAKKEKSLRLTLRLTTAACCVGLMVYPTIYFLDMNHFTIANLAQDIIDASLVALIPAAIGLLLCFGCAILSSKSIQREIAVYKQAIADNKGSVAPIPCEQPKSTGRWILAFRCLIFATAICFIALGIFNGGAQSVYEKAIAICTECIGLG